MSGKKIDASEDVKKLVAELVELKAARPDMKDSKCAECQGKGLHTRTSKHENPLGMPLEIPVSIH